MENNKLPYRIKPGFKVPDNYFQDFEASIMHKVIEDNQQTEIPVSYKGNPGFSIPEGYFDNLETRILDEVGNDRKVIPLFSARKLFYAAAIAAVFIGIISTVFFNDNSTVSTIDSLELSALEDYIEEGYFDLDFNELSAFMYEQGYSFGDYSTSGISEEAVYDYINENVENPELLYE